MRPTCNRISDLVVTMQDAFLNQPDLTLSLDEAERRFGVDGEVAHAILSALVDAGVLLKLRRDLYARLFPRMMPRLVAAGRHAAA